MHESLDEFKFQPDTTTNIRVICPYTSEKLMYNVVNTLAPLFLIGSSSFLQERRTTIKSWTCSKGLVSIRGFSWDLNILIVFWAQIAT